MEILVIDGQGGGMGRGIVDEVRRCFPQARIRAVGTNSIATGNMRRPVRTSLLTEKTPW